MTRNKKNVQKEMSDDDDQIQECSPEAAAGQYPLSYLRNHNLTDLLAR